MSKIKLENLKAIIKREIALIKEADQTDEEFEEFLGNDTSINASDIIDKVLPAISDEYCGQLFSDLDDLEGNMNNAICDSVKNAVDFELDEVTVESIATKVFWLCIKSLVDEQCKAELERGL